MAHATLITAVEVRTPDASPLTVWEMPVRAERRDDLLALVFHTESELTTVTLLLSEGDRRALALLLRKR